MVNKLEACDILYNSVVRESAKNLDISAVRDFSLGKDLGLKGDMPVLSGHELASKIKRGELKFECWRKYNVELLQDASKLALVCADGDSVVFIEVAQLYEFIARNVATEDFETLAKVVYAMNIYDVVHDDCAAGATSDGDPKLALCYLVRDFLTYRRISALQNISKLIMYGPIEEMNWVTGLSLYDSVEDIKRQLFG